MSLPDSSRYVANECLNRDSSPFSVEEHDEFFDAPDVIRDARHCRVTRRQPGSPGQFARCTRETAIRMALGATRGAVMMRVLREAALVSVVGVAIGLSATLVAVKAIASTLFGLAPTDPLTLGTVGVVLIGTALMAAFLPARRAAAIDPAQSLSVE